MACHKYYTVELKERVVKHDKAGHSFADAAAIVHVSKQLVSRWFDDTQHRRPLQNHPKTDGSRKTSKHVNKMIIRTPRSNSRLTASQIPTVIPPILDDKISTTIIKRSLGKEGLNGRVGVCKPLIPKKRLTGRKNLAKSHKDWSRT